MAQQDNQKKLRRSAYIWNTAGSMLNAFQSVIMLMAITRVASLEAVSYTHLTLPTNREV